MGYKNNPKYNQSGLADPTAYQALEPIMKEEGEIDKHAYDLIKIIKKLLNITGFELTERIKIRHKKSGKEFR